MTDPVTEDQFRWVCNQVQVAALKSRQPTAHDAVKIMADMWGELSLYRLKAKLGLPPAEG